MSQYQPDEAKFAELKGKVVVLAGGANGIGASTVRLLTKSGANVVFGDVAVEAGEKLASSLGSSEATFVRLDVTKYEDHVALFKTAFQKYGRVDHAVTCAGILEQGKWFDPDLTIEGAEKPETTKVMDVNYFGTLYFTRVAFAYLKHGKKEGENKSITLLSSAAGFRESPGLTVYQCSKHGVQGLMRTLRKVIYPRHGIRINTICPGLTDTGMTTNIIDFYKENNQPVNTPDHVAGFVLGVQTITTLNGEGVYIEGGRGWLIEENLVKTMPQWLGEGPTERLLEGLRLVSTGEAWKIK